MAKANTTKQDKTAAADKPKRGAKSTDGQQIKTDLTPPVEDPGRAPREDDIGRRERGSRNNRSLNDKEEGEDRVYGVSSRARWDGVDADIATLTKDAKEAEQSANDNKE